MIDIHCHILPGVDDGASSMEESIDMARLAYADGIRHIIATPHFANYFRVTLPIIKAKVTELQQELDKAGIDVTIYPGSEVRLEGKESFYQYTNSCEYCHLGNGGHYLLLEQPWMMYAPETLDILADLKEQGITAIIAHPERHEFFRETPSLLTTLLQAGAWTQVSVDSLLGKNGEDAKSFAEWLVQHNYVSTLATDAHNVERKPNLSAGFQRVHELAGEQRVQEINERLKQILVDAQLINS